MLLCRHENSRNNIPEVLTVFDQNNNHGNVGLDNIYHDAHVTREMGDEEDIRSISTSEEARDIKSISTLEEGKDIRSISTFEEDEGFEVSPSSKPLPFVLEVVKKDEKKKKKKKEESWDDALGVSMKEMEAEETKQDQVSSSSISSSSSSDSSAPYVWSTSGRLLK